MCETLKVKMDNLTKFLEKFTNCKKNLDTLLSNQRLDPNKEGIGYEQIASKNFLKNLFVRKSMGNKSHITCFYYGQKGHGIALVHIERELMFQVLVRNLFACLRPPLLN